VATDGPEAAANVGAQQQEGLTTQGRTRGATPRAVNTPSRRTVRRSWCSMRLRYTRRVSEVPKRPEGVQRDRDGASQPAS